MEKATRIELPAAARALTTLSRVDYEDAFLLELGSTPWQRSEEGARAMLEGAPARVRRELQLGWTALGLKLDRSGSEPTVLGWELRHSSAEFALLGADSWIGMPAELLFKLERERLLVATFVEQQNPVARAIWAAIGPKHRRVVPKLLRRAPAQRV